MLYLHIPFCKQACNYCNFHFSTSLRRKDDFLTALHREIELQKDFFEKNTPIESVYFGGGTPSLLSESELNRIFETLHRHFSINSDAEISLEANPDDLTKEYLQSLKNTPVNRLSIGVQSFRAEDLRFMHRAHTAEQSHSCIENAQSIGFENITIDYIYGVPNLSDADWLENLSYLETYNIKHFSAYALTVEPKTPLHKQIRLGKSQEVDDEQSARQFLQLMDFAEKSGFRHYEISNFCKENRQSRHNAAYWIGKHYLGLGPAAHSYNGNERIWNVSNNAKYIESICSENKIPSESEVLTPQMRYNEYIMTALRTDSGISQTLISNMSDSFLAYFLKNIQTPIHEGLVVEKDKHYTLTRQGKLFADRISMELFF